MDRQRLHPSFAVLLVTGGRLGDIFGRRRMFLFGVVVFGLSSAFIGFSQSEAWLVAGRAVQGIGAAFMMPATLSIISNAFPAARARQGDRHLGRRRRARARHRPRGRRLPGRERLLAVDLFPQRAGGRVAVFVTLAAARESRDETSTHHVDIPGVASISVGLAALVLALVEGNSWGWGSAAIIGLLAVAALAFVAFAVAERRVPEPMVDFAFFRSRSFLGSNLVAFIVSFAMLAMFFFLALYMQNIRATRPLQAGVRFLPRRWSSSSSGRSPAGCRIASARAADDARLLVVSASLFWQGHLTPDTSYGFLVGAFVLMGLGMGLVMSPMSTAAMNAVEPTKAGVGSGILSMSRMVGGTFGVAAMGALITGMGRSRIDQLLPGLPADRRSALADSLGAGGAQVGGRVGLAVQDAYVYALNNGLRIAAVVALLGAVLSWLLIADRVAAPAETTPRRRRGRERARGRVGTLHAARRRASSRGGRPCRRRRR